MRHQTEAITVLECAYASHEGNYAMSHMLAGARADESAGRAPARGAGGEAR